MAVPEGLQIGFAAADVTEIGRGVEALARAIETARTTRLGHRA